MKTILRTQLALLKGGADAWAVDVNFDGKVARIAVEGAQQPVDRVEAAAIKYLDSHPTGPLSSVVVDIDGVPLRGH